MEATQRGLEAVQEGHHRMEAVEDKRVDVVDMWERPQGSESGREGFLFAECSQSRF